MTRLVDCVKLQKNTEGLERQPYPGELGKKIYESISKEAWLMWLAHQTMLINEYRLSMLDIKSREFLAQEMQNFLFGTGSDKPSGYIEPQK
jgi:Fe-S cluster biosynthesis and repair protein YggX